MLSSFRNFVLLPASVAVLATSAAMAATIKVPFSFTVDGRNCPAGTYSIDQKLGVHAITLHSQSEPISFTWSVKPDDAALNDSRVTLRFQGQAHTLQSVQYKTFSTANLDRHLRTKELEGDRAKLAQQGDNKTILTADGQ